MDENRIEKRVELNAPISRVWRALTDAIVNSRRVVPGRLESAFSCPARFHTGES